MKRFGVLFMLLLTVLALPVAAYQPVNGTISGTIYRADGVTPIADANVMAADFSGGFASTKSDLNGAYTLNVPPGGYHVFANATNRALEFYDGDSGSTHVNESVLIVNVTEGGTTPDINFKLNPAGMISGKVTDETTGLPLVDFMICVDSLWNCETTNAQGIYLIKNIAVNTDYRVSTNFYQNTSFYINEWWKNKYYENLATPVRVPGVGKTLTGINFALKMGGIISGKVVAAEDNTEVIDGVWLCAFDFDAPYFDMGRAWNCTQTNVDGTYTIRDLFPGTKRLWIFPEDRARLFYNNSPSFTDATPVTVVAGQENSNIDFALPEAGIISGMVYQADGVTPANGDLSVIATDEQGNQYMECTQNGVNQPLGSYRVFVPAGEYTVWLKHGVCASTGEIDPQFYGSDSDYALPNPVTVVNGQTTGSINFVSNMLQKNGTFEYAGVGANPALKWVGANLTNDLRVCNTATSKVAHSGRCAFLFTATPGAFSTITQTISNPPMDSATDLVLRAWIKSKSLNGARVEAVVFYSDTSKTKVQITGISANSGYNYYSNSVPLNPAKTVSKIKLVVGLNNGTGKFWIDDVSVERQGGAGRDNGWIPLP